jgi:hypothetical protein
MYKNCGYGRHGNSHTISAGNGNRLDSKGFVDGLPVCALGAIVNNMLLLSKGYPFCLQAMHSASPVRQQGFLKHQMITMDNEPSAVGADCGRQNS